MGVPDGPYTVVAVLDRLGQVAESNEANNRYAVSGKRVLVVRPSGGANLVLENFLGVPSLEPLGPGRGFLPIAKVRNAGTENSGTFWIEFWASRDQSYPQLDFILCDSIKIENLAPGEMLDLAEYWCIMYRNVPPGNYAIVCFVDRVDQVNETDESDNYQFLRDQSIVP
jgi:subtilase family serine protease